MNAELVTLAGSLRAGSFNRQLSRLAARIAREAGATVTELDLREFPLPLFDEDLERDSGIPERALELKRAFKRADGVVFACPEYNSSITAVMKNTIDWISRPVAGERPFEPFEGKLGLLLSASPGALGGLRGLVIVRLLLGNLRMVVLPDQLTISHADRAFSAEGSLEDSKQSQALVRAVERLVTLCARLRS
jgi:NAD(P)H-dependent FMN reductase